MSLLPNVNLSKDYTSCQMLVFTRYSIVESFEEVATRFAQQSNLTVKFTDVTIIVELVSTVI